MNGWNKNFALIAAIWALITGGVFYLIAPKPETVTGKSMASFLPPLSAPGDLCNLAQDAKTVVLGGAQKDDHQPIPTHAVRVEEWVTGGDNDWNRTLSCSAGNTWNKAGMLLGYDAHFRKPVTVADGTVFSVDARRTAQEVTDAYDKASALAASNTRLALHDHQIKWAKLCGIPLVFVYALGALVAKMRGGVSSKP